MEKGDSKELIAEDIALVSKDGDNIILHSLFKDISAIEGVDISLIDTLNSTMLIKSKTLGVSQ